MGAYVSTSACKENYNVTINCNLTYLDPNDNHTEIVRIGDVDKGQFPGNPDIAGVGIYGSFIAVTAFTLAVSLLDLGWIGAKAFKWKTRHDPATRNRLDRLSVSDIFESIILTCSDTQIFTGAAYALTLRYWEGCTITAYHYNIVSNMMLLTTATHLMSVTMVRDYWKFQYLAIVRIICITGAFLVTGLLLSNANALGKGFPTEVPKANESYSDILRLAACFQDQSTGLVRTLENSVSSAEAARNAFIDSSPGNKIVGWNQYLVLLLWYFVAVIGETVRYIRRGVQKGGGRKRLVEFLKKKLPSVLSRQRWFYGVGKSIIGIYLTGGIAVSSYTVVLSGRYMTNMRSWVAHSGWLKIENGKNPENDATTFGQLVPIFLTALIVWSLLTLISEKVNQKSTARRLRKDLENSGGSNGQVEVQVTTADLDTPSEKKAQAHVEVISVTNQTSPDSQTSTGNQTPPKMQDTIVQAA